LPLATPCCNGRYSWRDKYETNKRNKKWVLILVVMEDTLGEIMKRAIKRGYVSS